MLLVNAKSGPSRIHGTGLFAQEFIPKGTKVWEFRPGFDVAITEADLGRLPSASREQAVYWSYFHLATRTFVMSSDDDRFTNHSDDPNTRVVDRCTVAVRDIQLGDEITNDYNELGALNFAGPNGYGSKWVGGAAMQPVTVALLATIGLCIVTVVGDYLLKRASNHPAPLNSWWFVAGFVVYSSTAFGWLYVMRHLRFATFGAVYAVASVLLLALVGVLFLGESLKWQEVVGIAMAVGAVVLLARFAG